MTYSEKLKDPRWQKKRLEILQAHNFTCDGCADHEKTLHVHHGYYQRDLQPWEYSNETLHVFCEECHLEREDSENGVRSTMASMTNDELCDFLPSIGILAACAGWHAIFKICDAIYSAGNKSKSSP